MKYEFDIIKLVHVQLDFGFELTYLICMYVCMYVCMRMNMYRYVYIYRKIYVHSTHIFICYMCKRMLCSIKRKSAL